MGIQRMGKISDNSGFWVDVGAIYCSREQKEEQEAVEKGKLCFGETEFVVLIGYLS